jgi:hypothetical protein
MTHTIKRGLELLGDGVPGICRSLCIGGLLLAGCTLLARADMDI